MPKIEGLDAPSIVLRRLVKAVAFVAAAIALIAAMLLASSWQRANASVVPSGKASYASRFWEMARSGKDANEALLSMGFSKLEGNELPDWFESEITSASKAAYATANEEASLVYMAFESGFEETSSALSEELSEKGWIATQSGQENVRVFVKGEGECRWLMAELDPIGGETSVVLHIGRT